MDTNLIIRRIDIENNGMTGVYHLLKRNWFVYVLQDQSDTGCLETLGV